MFFALEEMQVALFRRGAAVSPFERLQFETKTLDVKL
jgi:hypothetical protein